MLRIGLTGGIGSGKSTVAALLAGHGAALVDTDAIARRITLTGGATVAHIAAAFGPFLAGAGFTAMFFGADSILRAIGL